MENLQNNRLNDLGHIAFKINTSMTVHNNSYKEYFLILLYF